MGTICHIRPVDKDQNVSSGDAEQTWPPAEGLAEMAGVTEFAVRNYELGLRARRPEARRGGRGVGRDAREAGLRGDLRGGVPRLEARVQRGMNLISVSLAFF